MTGTKHYQAAERLIEYASLPDGTVDTETFGVDPPFAAAQVHATLAQAAAVIDVKLARPSQWYGVLQGGES